MQSVKVYKIPDDDLIDEIGEHLGFQMWNKRDRTKSYEYAGNRDGGCEIADDYYEGRVISFKEIPLLVFQRKGIFAHQSEYTFNLKTMRPTKNSGSQVLLPKDLITKIKASHNEIFFSS